MSGLKAGFARLDATPMLGIPVRGYYQVRLADGVLDPIELNALAISCGGNTAVLITLDTCAIDEDETNAFLAAASAAHRSGSDSKTAVHSHVYHAFFWNAICAF